jgi:hypothetical protein
MILFPFANAYFGFRDTDYHAKIKNKPQFLRLGYFSLDILKIKFPYPLQASLQGHIP